MEPTIEQLLEVFDEGMTKIRSQIEAGDVNCLVLLTTQVVILNETPEQIERTFMNMHIGGINADEAEIHLACSAVASSTKEALKNRNVTVMPKPVGMKGRLVN